MSWFRSITGLSHIAMAPNPPREISPLNAAVFFSLAITFVVRQRWSCFPLVLRTGFRFHAWFHPVLRVTLRPLTPSLAKR